MQPRSYQSAKGLAGLRPPARPFPKNERQEDQPLFSHGRDRWAVPNRFLVPSCCCIITFRCMIGPANLNQFAIRLPPAVAA